MDLRRLVLFLNRWILLVIVGTVIAGGTAYLVSAATSDTRYRSTATLLVGPALATADANSAQLEAARRVAAIYVHVALSRPVLERVASELDLSITPELLRLRVTATTPQDPPVLTITAEARDAEQAADIANEMVRELIAISPAFASEEEETARFVAEQILALEAEIAELGDEVDRLAAIRNPNDDTEEELQALRDRLAAQRSTYAALVDASRPGATTLLTVIEEAVPSPVPLPGGRAQMIIFAAVIGFVGACGVALLIEYLDDTVKSGDDVARLGGMPNLASIASIPSAVRRTPGRLQMELTRHSPAGESFQALRAAIELTAPKPIHGLLVTSALRNEGKTTVAASLAIVFAQAGRDVLLVDADLRQPALHRQFGMENRHGLSDLLSAPDAQVNDLARPTGIPHLRILPAGVPPGDAAALAGSSKMKELVARLRRQSDLVIVDSPAMLAAAETALLASYIEWTLLVISAGRTSVGSLADVSHVLGRSKAKVIGAVLNRVPRGWYRERWTAYGAVPRFARVGTPLDEESSG